MREAIIQIWLLPLCMLLAFVSCSDHDADDIQPAAGDNLVTTKEVVIAVVLPMDDTNKKVWENTADWLLQNVENAQKKLGSKTIYLPKLEYYDENNVNLPGLGKQLAEREDVKIVIGPLENNHVESVAQYILAARKPLITPSCTASEVCRKFSGKDFFWSLCESDITELTMMLSEASAYLSHCDPNREMNLEVSLITAKEPTSNTYLDWFEYEAIEMKLNMGKKYTYYYDNQITTIKNIFRTALGETQGVLLCAPTSEREVKAMIEVIIEFEQKGAELPYCIFSNKLYSPGLQEWEHEGLKDPLFGFCPLPDPATGFLIRYKSHMMVKNELPFISQKYAAQYYDALMVSALAIWEVENGKTVDYRTAIADIVADKDNGQPRQSLNGWDEEYLCQIYHGLQKGIRYDLKGASGSIQFDPEVQSSSTRTVYASIMYDNSLQIIDYLTKDGTSHTNSNTVKWEEHSAVYTMDEGSDVSYEESASDKWALLVSSSTKWEDYRHTADVLSVYHMLRKNNYPPDHIIVVADRSLAFNSNYPTQGKIIRWDSQVVFPYEDESNIIDYQVWDKAHPNADDGSNRIKAKDIFEILKGNESAHLPKVLKTDSRSNVLVYWSGHGNALGKYGTSGKLVWGTGDDNSYMTTQNLRNFLHEYQEQKKYRKMLWILEPCYSASLAIVAEDDINHVLFMTSATGSEESKANDYSWNKDYECWLSDQFSQNLVTTLEKTPKINFYDLYEELVKKTTGSHPQVIGARHFGLLSKSYPSEFFEY